MTAASPASQSLASRDRRVARVLWLVLLLNWLVAACKILVGALARNVTVLGDGLHSLMDGVNNIVGIIALKMAGAPPDEDHPYGHRKFENIAAMLIGGLIVLMAWQLATMIVHILYDGFVLGQRPETPSVGSRGLYAGVVLGAMGVNIGVALYERARGVELQSSLLKADSAHTMSDSLVTALSLSSLFLSSLWWWVDSVLAIGVIWFLGRAAWTIIVENLPAFTDRCRLDAEQIRQVVEQVGGVEGTRRIRSHGTETDIHMDMDIFVDGSLTAEETEEIERNVRRALRDAYPNVTMIGIHHRTMAPPEGGAAGSPTGN